MCKGVDVLLDVLLNEISYIFINILLKSMPH